MLINLKFKATFTTGKTLQGYHEFKNGMSSITGGNETGKSFRLEMIRYSLFGTEALRAATKYYQSISSELTFSILGKDYKVTRDLKTAKLFSGEEQLAVGNSPVNNAIKKIFGYDLEVFDSANACLQGEIEAMTDKTPAERKKMVDRTIGLDSVDKVIDEVNKELSGNKKALELLTSKTIETLIEPVKPSVLSTLEEIREVIKTKEEIINKKNYISGLLKGAEAIEPAPYNSLNVDCSKKQEYTDELNSLNIQKASIGSDLEKIKQYETLTFRLSSFDIETIRKYIDGDYETKWSEYNLYKSKYVSKPVLSKDEIAFLRLVAEIDRHNYVETQHIECPACKHEFHIAPDKSVFTRKEYDEVKLKEIVDRTNFNWLNPSDLEKRLSRAEVDLEAYEKFISLPVVEQPALERSFYKPEALQLQNSLEELKLNFNYEQTMAKVNEFNSQYLTKKTELEQKLSFIRIEEENYNNYLKAKEKYEAYKKLLDEHTPWLKSVGAAEETLAEVKRWETDLLSYQRSLDAYQIRLQAQSEAIKATEELTDAIKKLELVKKSLNELKPRVKTHLLPSLNLVASSLISEMTGGKRNKIVVDDNFDINVDDQPVGTLSGSGKAVANLAVRIALGTVLTNKVFSVFLADEIDAAMDDERAEYTAQCLRNLTKTFNQIILVSHKDPEVDNKIIL